MKIGPYPAPLELELVWSWTIKLCAKFQLLSTIVSVLKVFSGVGLSRFDSRFKVSSCPTDQFMLKLGPNPSWSLGQAWQYYILKVMHLRNLGTFILIQLKFRNWSQKVIYLIWKILNCCRLWWKGEYFAWGLNFRF